MIPNSSSLISLFFYFTVFAYMHSTITQVLKEFKERLIEVTALISRTYHVLVDSNNLFWFETDVNYS